MKCFNVACNGTCIEHLLISGICFLAVPPTVAAKSESVAGIVSGNAMLNFTVGDEANPPVYSDNITVTFNSTPVPIEDRFSLQLNENIFTFEISLLTHADEGVYTVTVTTIAGGDTAKTLLALYGEQNGSK